MGMCAHAPVGMLHVCIHVETRVNLGCCYSGADCLPFEIDSLAEPKVQVSARLAG